MTTPLFLTLSRDSELSLLRTPGHGLSRANKKIINVRVWDGQTCSPTPVAPCDQGSVHRAAFSLRHLCCFLPHSNSIISENACKERRRRTQFLFFSFFSFFSLFLSPSPPPLYPSSLLFSFLAKVCVCGVCVCVCVCVNFGSLLFKAPGSECR